MSRTVHAPLVALPDPATTRSVMREARRANPTAPLLARAAHENEELLSRLGATVAVAPERADAELLIEEGLRLTDLAASAQRQPS